ncbi:MAG: hypothetical protein U1F71_23655 [Verrucomicrobiaceae bacterium]
MNPASLPGHLLALSMALVCTACTSPTWRQAQRSDGLIGFVLGAERMELPVTVEKVSSVDGTIVSAHVHSIGSGAVVFGSVQRHALQNPPLGSHVDVIVLDARGKAVERHAVEYLPRDLPSGQRTCFLQSRYTVRLASRPPPESSVKIIFHGAPRSGCDLASHP